MSTRCTICLLLKHQIMDQKVSLRPIGMLPSNFCLLAPPMIIPKYNPQLYISFSPKAHSSQADAVASIEHSIQNIRQWMSQDKLLMNDAKTELLLIGTRQQLAKITIDGITVGHCHCSTISCSESGCAAIFI